MAIQSGKLNQGDNYEIKFDKPGIFNLECQNLPRINLKIIVKNNIRRINEIKYNDERPSREPYKKELTFIEK